MSGRRTRLARTRMAGAGMDPDRTRSGPRRADGRPMLLAALVAAVLAWPGAVEAQQRPQGRRGEVDRERLEERIRAQMGRMMQQRLGLDAEQSDRLAAVVQDFEVRRRDLFQQEQSARREVETFLRGGATDEAAARELVARVADLRLQEAELFGQEQEALLEVLTPVQLLRLQELRQELGRRIRELRGGRDGGVERRRGGGPGPGALRGGPEGVRPGPAGLPRDAAPRGPVRIL